MLKGEKGRERKWEKNGNAYLFCVREGSALVLARDVNTKPGMRVAGMLGAG